MISQQHQQHEQTRKANMRSFSRNSLTISVNRAPFQQSLAILVDYAAQGYSSDAEDSNSEGSHSDTEDTSPPKSDLVSEASYASNPDPVVAQEPSCHTSHISSDDESVTQNHHDAIKDSCTSGITEDPISSKSDPVFPQEIFDYIADMLWNDEHALLAWSLACRAFVPRSQFHLHRKVMLRDERSCRKATDIYGMESSRRLLRYIREVHILGPRPVHPDFASMGQWMNDELATCLSHLNPAPALEEILISYGRSIVWGSDTPILRSVKKLTLWKCEFGSPPDFTDFLSNYFPNLTTLIIKDLRFLDTFGDPEKPGPRPHLHTLEINSSATQEFLLHWFLYQPPEDIRLENLSYTIAQWQVYAAPASLKALGSSVKHLTVNFAFPSPHQLLKGDPFLATFTTLQTLVFDCSTLYGTLYGPPSVPVLLQCVKAKDIASLQFRFALGDGASCDLEDTAQQISRIRLSETSKLLHTLRPFKHLSSVLVHVRLNEWSKCMRIRSTEWVERQLEQHRGPLTLPDGTRMSNLEMWALRGFDATRAAEYERQFMQTSYRSYDQARQTWRKASNALEQALPLAHAAGILHIEPVECEKEPHLNRRC